MHGEWHKPTVDPPLAVQIGDVLLPVPGKIEHWRNGIKIGERLLSLPGPVVAINPEDGTPVTATDTLTHLFFFVEKKMPGIIETLTQVTKNQTTGAVHFGFDDIDREFADEATALAAVEYLDTEGQTAQDILILKTLRKSPDFTNLENMVGGSCSLDMQAIVPVVLTEPI